MDNIFESFKKTKDYLICVDSDGCAIDTMDIKHHLCFGPCMVKEWNLEQWQEKILARWNDINLYTMTRGINRFKGLAKALSEINDSYIKIEDIDLLLKWVDEATELSNQSLERMADTTGKVIFRKALSWSKAVNKSITELPESKKKPFENVKEGLMKAHSFADVAIVSSANRDAVEEEWGAHGLIEHVDIILCQDAGSKLHCISRLKEKGYDSKNILMIGDAPGDQAAAEINQVHFYPILVKQEAESWKELEQNALELFKHNNFTEYEERKMLEFKANLKGE